MRERMKRKCRATTMSIMPRTFFSTESLVTAMSCTPKYDAIINVASMGRSLCHSMCRQVRATMMSDVVDASSPDSVVASPYDDIMWGNTLIMNIPNPNPHTRCTKLAARAKTNNMLIEAISITYLYKREYAATCLAVTAYISYIMGEPAHCLLLPCNFC